jgi:transketolase
MPVDMRDAIFDKVYNLAKADRSVIFLTADLGSFSLLKFRKFLPNQFINMGIAEQNMITVAAGLALAGKKVFVYSIIPFVILRCLEQIKVCLVDMNLQVCIIGGGAGFTYGSDGPTHHAIQDIGIIRALGNIVIYNPCDQITAVQSIQAAYSFKNPTYIRIANGAYNNIYMSIREARIGLKRIGSGTNLYIITTGAMTHRVLKAVAEELGKAIGIIDVCRIDKLSINDLRPLLGDVKNIVVIEEHYICGGLGALIEESLSGERFLIRKIGIKDITPGRYGSQDWLLDQNGISENAIRSIIYNEYRI